MILLTCLALCLTFVAAEAQFMKKLKNTVNNAVNEIAGDEAEKELSLGTAAISQEAFGETNVEVVRETKITKYNESTLITGSWRTHDADIFDGYSLEIGEAKDDLTGTYVIGTTNSFKIGYDPSSSSSIISGPAVSSDYQNLEFISGEVTISSAASNNFSLSFKGKAKNSSKEVSMSGNIKTNQMLVFNNKTYSNNTSESPDSEETIDYANYSAFSNMSSSDQDTNLKPKYSFSHKIIHEVTTDQSKDVIKMAYLFSNEAYYGIGVNMSDYGEQGESFIVMDNGETHMFINAGGMKMRMSQMPGGGMPIPKQDFNNPNNAEIKKTGATKNILGYTCYEYTVKDEDVDAQFWVTPDLRIKNWMSFEKNEMEGHILEYDVRSKDGKMKSVAVEVNTNANLTIKSSEYRKGF